MSSFWNIVIYEPECHTGKVSYLFSSRISKEVSRYIEQKLLKEDKFTMKSERQNQH